MTSLPNAEVFRQEIQRMINAARSNGKKYADIVSGDVHRNVGGYLSQNHRMASCCEVMYFICTS
jgi:hypothetical protein